MKLQILAILFFINLQAQENLEPKKFFEYFFKNTTEKIIYTEVYFHDFEEITESLKYNSTLKCDNINSESKKLPDSISLTSQELKYVIEQFEQNNGKKLSPSLIPNSKHILRKKVDKIFSERDKGWTYFHKNIGKKIYSFSKPVYLRNNSICFFYFSSGCGSLCGGGGFSVYIKVDGIWYSYRSLSMWIS
jgi:hypothetical protein